MDDWRLRVCLERTIELPEVDLQLRDWPGAVGPLVHVPDPLSPDDSIVNGLAEALAPGYRVVSVKPRGASPYQVDAADLLALLDQFGFATPVVVAERLGCLAALLISAWHAGRVAGLVLIDPIFEPPAGGSIEARAVRDCPPNWAVLRAAVQCPVLELLQTASVVERVAQFLAQLGPGLT
ncbi:MAG: hypothetical protein ACR2IK_00565 [Chloroflexota bacterium]